VLVPLDHYYLSFLSMISLSVYILSSIPFLFADDTKCMQIINSFLDANHLQGEFHSVAVIPIFSSVKVNLFIFTSGQKLQLLPTHTWSMAKQSSENRSTKPGDYLHQHSLWSEHCYHTLGFLHHIFKTNYIQVKKQLYIL